MPRFFVFWEEFRKEIGWIADFPDKIEKLKKRGGSLLWLLGVIGYSTKNFWADWLPQLQSWSPVLLAAIVWFVAWKAATAWHKTLGPVIWLGELEPDDNYKMFDMRVENRGNGEVIAHVYAVELRDAKEKRIPRIDTEIPLHWRGLGPGLSMRLYGDKHGTAGVLMADDKTQPDKPQLCLTTPRHEGDAVGDFRVVPLSVTPEELGKQQELRLTIRVDFLNDGGEILKTKKKRFAIIPDTSSGMCYRVSSI